MSEDLEREASAAALREAMGRTCHDRVCRCDGGLTCDHCLPRVVRAGLASMLAALAAAAHDLALAEDALREIAERKGPFSRDPLTHASNTIEAMGRRADDALRVLAGGEP